ncbi:multidrug efflux RND transporter permease subunit AdeE [Acinetobacter sp. AR_0276]|uniref:multidrug efflux RND transporter permease subunit AdeE n=1 Tax=Acinetobacter sp. AR_0276 TaxID=1841507 RepID=UPI000D032FD5|nr:multidrug efflux RND transporter permease subunit AdeE [Acinetobacter sp. AR_0276]PRV96427.1 RND transporter, hydrophobe/amphiphile efflux-1 family protein [Acinetobacter sp. AR_0276]
MLSSFFIARPIFAWVLSICIMALGTISILTLPIEQYPDIAPPGVNVTANYPGASAKTVEDSVTQILEQQIKGIDGLLYFSSSSSSAGQARISLSFNQKTNPDTAQVQVQNAVNQALSRLPQEVQQQGITVTKSQGDSLLVFALYDESNTRTSVDISDYMVSTLQDPLSRVDGVGEITVFGAQYAMRIWLDPHKLNSYGLMPSDVRTAIEAQNAQITAGELGALPTRERQALNATVTALSRLQTVNQFENIILRTQTNGAVVLLKDVARVERGAENYQTSTRLNGKPASGMSIQLASGANALETAERVKAEVTRLTGSMPSGLKVAYPRDSTPFVEASVKGVIKTLAEAIVLVIIVMFLFLQSWRATLIPAIAVPVVLLGTFGVLSILGYSINTLTLFAMVLAIGLLVDDAIVVVENVERVMHEQHIDARQATLISMKEISGALVGIAMVLAAVFLPMAFFGGSVGIIYRQFSVTLVSAMVLSAIVALTLSPALCATLLKPANEKQKQRKFFSWFNRKVEQGQSSYRTKLLAVLDKPKIFMIIFLGITALLGWQYTRMNTGFLPQEDQGSVMVQFSTPVGTTLAETERVGNLIADYFLTKEKDNLNVIFMVMGRNNAGSGQNVGMAFAGLKHWDDREGSENTAEAVIARANSYFKSLRNARVQVLSPAAVRGLGQSSGFELWLQDAENKGRDALDALLASQNNVLKAASADSDLAAVRLNSLEDKAQLQVDIDQRKASALGLAQTDISNTLSSAWGGSYINDFIDQGRVKRVYMQGDAIYRSLPQDIGQWYVRGATGQMTPFSSFSSVKWQMGPQMLQRFNGLSAVQIQGSAATGESSGGAMDKMQELVDQQQGFNLQWSGLSYQEKLAGGQTIWLYLASIIFIFLCLAALYESWSIPVSVMLVIPLGLIGAVVAASLAGFVNDIYFQVAMLTTIGLSAKNAILIVEFAAAKLEAGQALMEAIIEEAGQRLRPIIMTSLAFVAGVLPLAVSTGAGAVSRKEIGIAVTGGMISGTLLSIFFVPLFFLLVRRLTNKLNEKKMS